MSRITRTRIDRLGEYADQPEDEGAEGAASAELVIPEDLTTLSDEDLATLREQAGETFDTLYGDGGQGLTDEDLETLASIADGIDALNAEITTRNEAAAERVERAAALAARTRPEPEPEAAVEDETEQPEGEASTEVEAAVETVEQPEAVAAAAAPTPRREIRVNAGSISQRRPAAAPSAPSDGMPTRMQDIVIASGESGAFAAGTGLDWNGVGRQVDRRLGNYNHGAYEAAARTGRRLTQQFPVVTIAKPIAKDLILASADPMHVEEVLTRAVDQHRLPGGSLTAAGGWCAPSLTIYDLCEIESRDGLYSLPTIGISRGGINHTLGPDFGDIYAAIPGFNYTEAEDIAGDYDGVGGGSKPCYTVPCPDFDEDRLQTSGLCISAGLLQQKGYPEVIARTVRGALVAHDHRTAGRVLAAVAAGSTAVTMPAATPGAAAPLLQSIEMQVEHFRYVTRISRATGLEAVFPFWVRGVIRADLSRRSGQNLLDVTDAQIDGWFRQRGINPQFVYNWQDITGGAAAFVAYPTTVKFLLYAAGTWVQGGGEVITVENLFDSTLLGTNDYTALFTEESWLVAQRCHDSRVVEVAICADGTTAAGIDFACNGTVAA